VFVDVPATTEKDRVRLAPNFARAVVTLPVTLRFGEPRLLREILRRTFS
jgi:hypothetical protein